MAAMTLFFTSRLMTILLVNVFGVTFTPARPAGYSREKKFLTL
jgi:hypothetical protein